MKILLFGATGRLGQRFLEEALIDGHVITAICRTPLKLDYVQSPSLVVIHGDAENLADIEDVFKNQDVIISCLADNLFPNKTVFVYSKFMNSAINYIKK
ncbi:hypothetical protein MXB_5649 [Myxobolus squamalis]|nr:hypothetical protein MXB_5649 [Myxobolus squamalis]